MRGGFSHDLRQLRDRLIQFSALIELELDFSQEDVEFADRTQLQQLITQLTLSTDQLLNSFRLGNVIRNGVQVAIIGKPNAGKSTLLNTLLNENRAIVSDIAGTTRDTIEEVLNINGILFRLIDTAGIREHTQDVIETLGVEKSREKMRSADIVVYLFDINETTPEELQQVVHEFTNQQINYLLVANKCDTPSQPINLSTDQPVNYLSVSAKQSTNIQALRDALVTAALDQHILPEATIVTNARHYEALQQLSRSLADVQQGLNDRLPGDLLALDIRQCLHYLGTITGQITNEDQLDFIFSKFCIGK
jgi:tRNA modification GTPase